MTETEMFAFTDIVRDLRRVFPVRGDEHDLAHLQRAYFKALRRFSIVDLAAGAEAHIQRGKHFPKPAEWIQAIPPKTHAVDTVVMSDVEAREYRRAEDNRWEDKHCHCTLCVAAGVTDQRLRFVPESNADGTDRKVRDPIGDRMVTAGHWIHGVELASWYAAKAKFWDDFRAFVKTKKWPTTTGASKPRRREPGDDDL